MRLRLGHSPDSDDAFMFWGLASGRVRVPGLEFEHILRDIETLNQWAQEGRLDVTAVSVHGYAYVSDRYRVLPYGASMGDGYGPKLVAAREVSPPELSGRGVAIPGRLTSAFLAMRLWWRYSVAPKNMGMPSLPEPRYDVVAFDRIMDAVEAGQADAGLLIHEGQLTYTGKGLKQLVDLGQWWKERTGLPLPLGINVVRRDLPPEIQTAVARGLQASIEAALEHRDEALTYALQFARGLPRTTADEFVGMYVNEWTRDPGDAGREAIRRFIAEGVKAGFVPSAGPVEYVD